MAQPSFASKKPVLEHQRLHLDQPHCLLRRHSLQGQSQLLPVFEWTDPASEYPGVGQPRTLVAEDPHHDGSQSVPATESEFPVVLAVQVPVNYKNHSLPSLACIPELQKSLSSCLKAHTEAGKSINADNAHRGVQPIRSAVRSADLHHRHRYPARSFVRLPASVVLPSANHI